MGKMNEQIQKIEQSKQAIEQQEILNKMKDMNNIGENKLTPEQQNGLREAIKKQYIEKKRAEEGWEVAGALTEQDVLYFKKLIMKEQQYMRAMAEAELKKDMLLQELKKLNEEQIQYEKQLHEKYELPADGQYKVDLQTNEILKKANKNE